MTLVLERTKGSEAMWDVEHWKKDPLSQKALARIAELEAALRAALDDLESNNEASAHLILKNAVT